MSSPEEPTVSIIPDEDDNWNADDLMEAQQLSTILSAVVDAVTDLNFLGAISDLMEDKYEGPALDHVMGDPPMADLLRSAITASRAVLYVSYETEEEYESLFLAAPAEGEPGGE